MPALSPLFASQTALPLLPCVAGVALLAAAFVINKRRYAASLQRKGKLPTVVHISPEAMYNDPAGAYAAALEEHGPVIAVPRQGRLEYIVGKEYTKEVLTREELYNFAQGSLGIMNLTPLVHIRGGSFVIGLDNLVLSKLSPQLPGIIRQVNGVFMETLSELCLGESETTTFDHVFSKVHLAIAKAMVILFLGEDALTEKNLASFIGVAKDMSDLTGMNRNTSWFAKTFPRTSRVLDWIRVIPSGLVTDFFFGLAPKLWREARANDWYSEYDDYEFDENVMRPLFPMLLRTHVKSDSKSRPSFAGFFYVLCLLLGLIFASVHQTAVVTTWTLSALARRPEDVRVLREELESIVDHSGGDWYTLRSLNGAQKMDSFIREVLRLKGDTLAMVRKTTVDAQLGPYVIPKGHLIYPLTTLTHEDTELNGADAKEFKGFRWVGTEQPAVMSTIGYHPFGMGKFACPGRWLAIAEIKSLCFALIGRYDLEGEAVVLDRINVTSVPPTGDIVLHKLAKPLI